MLIFCSYLVYLSIGVTRPCIYLLFTTLILYTHRKSIILPSIRALYFRSTILHYLRKVLLLLLNIKMRILQCKNIQYVFVNQKINLIATRHGSKMGGEKSRSRKCSNKSRAEEPSISRIIRVKIHRIHPFLAPPRRERVC